MDYLKGKLKLLVWGEEIEIPWSFPYENSLYCEMNNRTENFMDAILLV